jgi:hypothetical protein
VLFSHLIRVERKVCVLNDETRHCHSDKTMEVFIAYIILSDVSPIARFRIHVSYCMSRGLTSDSRNANKDSNY